MTFGELYAAHVAEGGALSERQYRLRLNYDVRKGRMLKLGRDDYEPADCSRRLYRYSY